MIISKIINNEYRKAFEELKNGNYETVLNEANKALKVQ